MSSLPSLTCPQCRGPLEYHVTIEMLNPAIGKIDTGYCPACACLFECVRETGTFYDSTPWPPMCRHCRQPVAFVSLPSSDDPKERLLYACREHPAEQWMLSRGTDRWTRRG